MSSSLADRIIATPSSYAKNHYLFVQETGTLKSVEPHISSRSRLSSYLILLVLSGRGRLFYNGSSFSLRQGSCVWIDCSLPYSHESSRNYPWELKWVHFNGKEALEYYKLYEEQGFPNVFIPSNPGGLNELLSSLILAHKNDGPYCEMMSHKYLTDIITMCFTENTPAYAGSACMSEKLAQVREYLKAHFDRRLTLDGLAERFFISKYHLARSYKQAYGITIGGELTALRISRAKSLLRFSTMTVEEIAVSCGCSDASYFTKLFKKAEGVTPLEYRRSW